MNNIEHYSLIEQLYLYNSRIVDIYEYINIQDCNMHYEYILEQIIGTYIETYGYDWYPWTVLMK